MNCSAENYTNNRNRDTDSEDDKKLPKRFKQSKQSNNNDLSNDMIKNDLKKEMIDYYDNTKNSIDIIVQNILIKIDKHLEIEIDEQRRQQILDYRRYLLQINETFVQYIDETCNNNMKDINNFNMFPIDNSNETKNKILKSYCLYIGNKELRKYLKLEFPIGILLTFDWFPQNEQLKILKSHYCECYTSCLLDQNVLNFIAAFEADTEVIQIKFCVIHFKKTTLLENVYKLKELSLDLSDYNITDLKHDAFINCKQLERLSFGFFDSLNSYNDEIFKSISTTLKKLTFYCYFPFDLNFNSLYNLKELAFFDSELMKEHVANMSFGNLNELTHVYFDGSIISDLNSLSQIVEQLKSIEYLSLRECELKECEKKLFDDFFSNIKITGLNLKYAIFEGGSAKYLPKMHHLKLLKIGSSCFNDIIIEKTDLNEIEQLSIEYDDNQEQYDPTLDKNSKFNEMKRLKNFKISFTPTFISLEINKKFFDFLSNQYNQIEYLKISYLKKCVLCADSFIDFKNLKSLKLNGNSIDILCNEILNGLNNLEMLDLSNNKIERLCSNVFSNLFNLKSLDLSSNKIVLIEKNTFNAFANKLEMLNLKGDGNLKFDDDAQAENFKLEHELSNSSIEFFYEIKEPTPENKFNKYTEMFKIEDETDDSDEEISMQNQIANNAV